MAQAAATGALATSAIFMASTIWSRTMRWLMFGIAINARIAMTATTTINSISVKPVSVGSIAPFLCPYARSYPACRPHGGEGDTVLHEV